MSKQPSQRDSATRPGGDKGQRDTLATASDLAQQAADKAKQTVSYATKSVTEQMKDMMDQQVGAGAEKASHVARSVRRAADDLEDEAPQVAGFVRIVADRIDGYADDLRDQSIDELVRKASDLARRQPALVFGLAALAGFVAYRTFKSIPSQPSRRRPMEQGYLH